MNIVIIDDHVFITESICKIVEEYVLNSKVTVYHDARQFLSFNNNNVPDLIITDLLMPELSGIELIKALCNKYPKTKIIVLSSISEVRIIKEALKLGVKGYLSKEVRIQEILKAITEVIGGEQYIEQKLKDVLLKNYTVPTSYNVRLSAREKEVLKLLCDSLDPKQIGDKLCISVHTVYSHQQNMMQKLNITRTADLILLALKNGLV